MRHTPPGFELRSIFEPAAARLACCKACDALNAGTCMQCGCYVEMRAARLDMHCPKEGQW